MSTQDIEQIPSAFDRETIGMSDAEKEAFHKGAIYAAKCGAAKIIACEPDERKSAYLLQALAKQTKSKIVVTSINGGANVISAEKEQ